jgi:hypothetical protein
MSGMAVGLADNRDRPASAGGANSPYLDTTEVGPCARNPSAGRFRRRRRIGASSPGRGLPAHPGLSGACAVAWPVAGTFSR